MKDDTTTASFNNGVALGLQASHVDNVEGRHDNTHEDVEIAQTSEGHHQDIGQTSKSWMPLFQESYPAWTRMLKPQSEPKWQTTSWIMVHLHLPLGSIGYLPLGTADAWISPMVRQGAQISGECFGVHLGPGFVGQWHQRHHHRVGKEASTNQASEPQTHLRSQGEATRSPPLEDGHCELLGNEKKVIQF